MGAGAAGVACSEIMLAHGVRNLVVCDIDGALYAGRPGLDAVREALAARTNPAGERGMADDVLAGADVLVGVSGPGAVSEAAVRRMAARPVVFAMANPEPEVRVEAVGGDVAIMATGRSDYPNQINNVLAFPGVFRGALDVRARTINEEMKLAAAQAIAGAVDESELHAEYIIPSVFNRDVVKAVALAVARAAESSGVARRPAANGNLNPSRPRTSCRADLSQIQDLVVIGARVFTAAGSTGGSHGRACRLGKRDLYGLLRRAMPRGGDFRRFWDGARLYS